MTDDTEAIRAVADEARSMAATFGDRTLFGRTSMALDAALAENARLSALIDTARKLNDSQSNSADGVRAEERERIANYLEQPYRLATSHGQTLVCPNGEASMRPSFELIEWLRMPFALEGEHTEPKLDPIARVKVEAGAAALEAFADSKWGQCLRGRLIVDTELSIRERAAALRSALEGEHTEPTIPPDDMWIKSSNDIRDRIKAAFTEPKLDPTPWFNAQATPQRSDHERYWDLFDPREWFSQDPAHYPGGTR